jgi:uncharacterized membrane protein YdjX (TVP38/TMEM64 family)
MANETASDPTQRLRVLLALAIGLLALALTWQFSPARAWLEPMRLITELRGVAAGLGLPVVLALFVLASSLAVPLSLLTLLMVLAFNPWQGAGLTVLGASLCAVLTFGLGRWLGQAAVARWANPKLQALNALAARRGLLAVIAVRLVPAAPFAVVNLALGTTRISWTDLLLGNVIGMLPMVGVTAWAAPQILAQLQHPNRWGLLALVGLLSALALGTWVVRRWVRRL